MHNPTFKLSQRKNCGLTLVELLIALALSSFVLLTAYALLSSQQSFLQRNQQQIHLEQNKRFTQFVLSRAIWQAGFLGCRSLANLQVHNQLRNNHIIPGQTTPLAIFAYQAVGNSWRPALPVGIHAKPGTDVLELVYRASLATELTTTMATPNSKISVNNTGAFKKDGIVVISDCEQADIIQINKMNSFKKQLLPQAPLSKAYAIPSQIGQLQYRLFYIQEENDTKNPVDALYMLEQSGFPEELVDHVSDLKLAFATQTTPTNYLTGIAVHDWHKIHSVRFTLQFNDTHYHETDSFITSLHNQ